MGMSSATCESWCVDGPTTLHDYDDDEVYMLVRADTDDPELQREIALVGAWDLEGERYARMIAAAPKLLAACRAVVERREHGDLAEAARMCAEAVQQATGASSGNEQVSLISLPGRDRLLEQLLARAEGAGLTSEDFDETVHELASSISADINNAGLEDQIGYLIDEWGREATARELDRVIAEKSRGNSSTQDR